MLCFVSGALGLKRRTELPCLVDFEPIDRSLSLLAMKLELKAVFQQRQQNLLELLRLVTSA